MGYSANPCSPTISDHGCEGGQVGHSLWRIRVSSAQNPKVRWVHLFSVPANGVTNEIRRMPWTDFKGQKLAYRSIVDCDGSTDPDCVLDPAKLTHISFLESEDTIAHALHLESITLTSNPIAEENVQQHHSEEAE